MQSIRDFIGSVPTVRRAPGRRTFVLLFTKMSSTVANSVCPGAVQVHADSLVGNIAGPQNHLRAVACHLDDV